MWIAHVCFSPCGETKRIANYFYEKTGGLFYDFTSPDVRDAFDTSIRYELVVLSLPVYSEDVPAPMKPWLARFDAEHYVLNFAYGGKSVGDVPRKVAALLGPERIVAWTATVTKHAFCDGNVTPDFSRFDPVLAKVNGGDLSACPVPKLRPTPFGWVVPNLRLKLGYRLRIDLKTCIRCNECVRRCPVRAITAEPKITASCIGCGLCPKLCPVGAISEKKSPILMHYLNHRKTAGAVVRTR